MVSKENTILSVIEMMMNVSTNNGNKITIEIRLMIYIQLK